MTQPDASTHKSKKLLQDLLAIAGARGLATAIVALRNVILAAFLVPADFGAWNLFLLVLRYGDHAHFGFRHALNREYPIAIGRQDVEDAEQVEFAAFDWNLIFSVIACAAIIGIALSGWIGDPLVFWGLVFAGVIVLVRQLSSYFLTLLRIRKEFFRISVLFVAIELAITGLVAALWPFFGVLGGVLALGIPHVLVAIYLWRKYPRRMSGLGQRLRADGALFIRLARVGLPMLAFGYLALVMLTIDRWLVLWRLDAETFGLYTFAALFISLFGMVSSIIGYVLLPTLGELHGASEQQRLREFLVDLNKIIGLVAPLVAAIGAALAPLVVIVLFPSYSPATETAQVLIAGATFSVIASAAGQFLIVSGRYRRYATIQVTSILVKSLLCLIALYLGSGMLGVAVGSTIGFALFGFAMLFFALRDSSVAGRDLAAQIAGYLVPWLLNFGVVGLAHAFIPVVQDGNGSPTISGIGLGVVLCGLLVVNVPSFVYLNRNYSLGARLRSRLESRRRNRMSGKGI